MSSSSSSLVVSCEWSGAPATFDLPSSADLSTLWKALKDTYPTLPAPFTAQGKSEQRDAKPVGTISYALASFRLTWKDAEGDDIELETQSDLADAIAQTMASKNRIMLLFVRPPTHSAMGRSGLLGEWDELESNSSGSPALAGQKAPAVEAPKLALEQPKESAPAPVVVAAAPEAAAAAPAAVPADATPSAGVLGWLWGRSPVAATPATKAAESKAPEVAAAPESTSSVPSPATGAAPLTDSDLIKTTSAKDWASVSQELSQPRDLEAQNSQNSSQTNSLLNSNTFVAAMDEEANNSRPDVLKEVIQSMLRRAEERVGVAYLPASGSSFSSGWICKPTQLIDALKDMDASAFAGVVEQFAEVAARHVAAREARLAAEEAARVAELVAEMERQARAEEQAREQARELARQAEERAEAQRKAEAAEIAAFEAKKREIALAEQKLQEERAAAAEMESRAAARAERAAAAAREAAAAAAAAAAVSPVPRLPSEPCLAFVPELQQPVLAPAAPQSPVMIPSVAVPVASPIGQEALSASQRINSLLTELRSMGFTNDQLNTQLLQQTNYDVGATLDWLATDAATGGELSAALRRVQ